MENFFKQLTNFQKGCAYVVGFIIIVCIIVWLSGFNFGQVSEGLPTYDILNKCKTIVHLKQGEWRTYFGKFTCGMEQSGITTDRFCLKLDISDNQCNTIYIYQVESQVSQ